VSNFHPKGGGYKFRTVPVTGCWLHGHQIRGGCHNKNQPTGNGVVEIVLFHVHYVVSLICLVPPEKCEDIKPSFTGQLEMQCLIYQTQGLYGLSNLTKIEVAAGYVSNIYNF
jgi:hypothetical protein